MRVDADKARDWMRKGAQPSDTVVQLLQQAQGVLEKPAAAANA